MNSVSESMLSWVNAEKNKLLDDQRNICSADYKVVFFSQLILIEEIVWKV